jgi:CubicO group peptidase (beta-lactamase class C family)
MPTSDMPNSDMPNSDMPNSDMPNSDMSTSAVAANGVWSVGSRPAGTDNDAVDAALRSLASLPEKAGVSLATLVAHRGVIVAEQYGPDTDADSTLISWSMAKSMTQTALGICVARGLLHLHAPAPVPEWQHDDRRHITIEHLLQMRSGLAWREIYTEAEGSDVIEMLFLSGKDDVAGYASALPLAHEPGTVWEYSSGTTNILARIITDALGGTRDAMETLLDDDLFGPLDMTSTTAKFDERGTFIGSSFVYATARDFARFGELYRLGGRWGEREIVPAWWAQRAATDIPVELPESESFGYSDHWWTYDRAGYPGVFAAHGFEGQRIIVLPDRELVVVQLSKNPDDERAWVDDPLHAIIRAFPMVRPT